MRSLKYFLIATLALGTVSAAQAELQNVELDGSIRIRGNYYNWDDNIFINGGEDQAWVEHRTRLGVTADFTDDVSLYTEFDAYNNWGDSFRSNFASGLDFAPVRDEVALYQSYIEVNNAWGLPLRTRMGRQELELGSEWLVGNNDTAAVFPGLSFDGVRTTYATDMFSVDLLTFKLNETFLDFHDGDTNMYGIYGSYLGMEDWQFDLYWLFVQEDKEAGAPVTNAALASVGFPGPGARETDLHTIGLRGAGTYGAFDLEAEGAFQFGEIERPGNPGIFGLFSSNNDLDYDAFAVNLEAGYTFDMAWTPRVYLGGAYFEGNEQDDDFFANLFGNTDDDLSFNRLFSNWEYSEFIENTELSNVWVLRAGISAMPTEKISLLLAASYFETDETNSTDGFLWWREKSEDTLGWELGLYGDYQYSEDLVFRAGYAHFFGDEDGLNGHNNSALNGLGALAHSDGSTSFLGLFGDDDEDADYDYLFWEAELSF